MTVYLQVADYIERFGEAETIRLTSETQPPALDEAKVERAIMDSEEEVDAYLRRLYTLPLASIPLTVAQIVADLTRENLHRSRPLPAVTDAAARARTMLKDYAAGRALLLLEEGEPEAHGDSAAVWGPSDDAIVFNADKLAGY